MVMVKLKHNNLPKATQLVNGRAGFKLSQFGDIFWTHVLRCPAFGKSAVSEFNSFKKKFFFY